MTAGDAQEPVGSVGEEAAKLLGAMAGWAREHDAGVHGEAGGTGGTGGTSGSGGGSGSDTGSGADGEEPPQPPGQPAECTWCPICRTLHLVRECTPEMREHLATATVALLNAAAGFLTAASAATAPRPDGGGPSGPSGPSDPSGQGGAPSARRGVERIDLDGDERPGEPEERTQR